MQQFVARKKMTIQGKTFLPREVVPMSDVPERVQGTLISQRRIMVVDVPEEKKRRGRPPKQKA